MFQHLSPPVRASAPLGWRPHDRGARPVAGDALVKVQFVGEPRARGDEVCAMQAATYDWAEVVAWRPVDRASLTSRQRIVADAGPWFAGMGHPLMLRFVGAMLAVAAAGSAYVLLVAHS